MGRFNTQGTVTGRRSSPKSAIKTVPRATAFTHEGGAGYANDAKGEAFRLGVNLFAGNETTFYESGSARDERFGNLISQLAVEDPAWTFSFLTWLRDKGNVRTASVMGAMYAIHARLDFAKTNVIVDESGFNRKFASLVPQRLDEVPEMFAMWQALFGTPFPSALKRGAGDALKRLANEYSMMKYNTKSHAWQVGDVLSIAHVTPDDEIQAQLFKMALANRYGTGYETTYLDMVQANIDLRAKSATNPKALLDPAALKRAGMTWEDVLSLAGNRLPKADVWNALILGKSLGYMAMLRNLRNFQEAGISKEATRAVQERLADPYAVANSRQFPFRFWSAYKNATGVQWGECLEAALDLSVGNLPALDGATLGLIDTSASMGPGYSSRSTTSMAENAAVFGVATALRNPGNFDLHTFATTHAPVQFRKGDSMLRIVSNVARSIGSVGHGTNTSMAVRDLFQSGKHTRVMVWTDMQSAGGYGTPISHVGPETWVYHWDLSGYKHGDIPSGIGRVHQLSGLTDATAKSIPLLENGAESRWPWEQ